MKQYYFLKKNRFIDNFFCSFPFLSIKYYQIIKQESFFQQIKNQQESFILSSFKQSRVKKNCRNQNLTILSIFIVQLLISIYIQKFIIRNTFRKAVMDSFTNIFHSLQKNHPDTPEQFDDYKLEFLNQHQQSYKELGDVLFTKDGENNQEEGNLFSLQNLNQEEQDLFDLEVQIKLRRYTSFQNGFMENHRRVLKNSLQDFLMKNSKFIKLDDNQDCLTSPYEDLKSYFFNNKFYNQREVQQNKQRLLKKVDQYKIAKEILESFVSYANERVIKDSLMMVMWILKHTDHLVSSIIHQNSFCIKEVQQIKNNLLEYLQTSENIDYLKKQVAVKSQSQKLFDIMIQTWLYTLLIAKLGYFENDCFDVEVTLQQHLKALLKQEKRQHSIFSDSQDQQIVSIEFLTKKRKI